MTHELSSFHAVIFRLPPSFRASGNLGPALKTMAGNVVRFGTEMDEDGHCRYNCVELF